MPIKMSLQNLICKPLHVAAYKCKLTVLNVSIK